MQIGKLKNNKLTLTAYLPVNKNTYNYPLSFHYLILEITFIFTSYFLLTIHNKNSSTISNYFMQFHI